MASRTIFEAWSKRESAVARPEPTRPISSTIANLFRKSGTAPRPGGVKDAEIEHSSGSMGPAVVREEPEQSQRDDRKTAFATSANRMQAAASDIVATSPDKDDLFRKRLALQRASNAWGPLLAAWSAAPAASHGTWTLPGLIAAIRHEAGKLASAASPGGADDERLRMAFVAMMARYVAGEIHCIAKTGHHLSQEVVANAGRDLVAMLEEPPAKALREPSGESVIVRGRTSFAISLMDAAVRLLPALARYAGRSTGDDLDRLVGLVHQRARTLTDEFLGKDASDKDRQSLLQSLLRRETDLLAAALDALPPGGLGSLSRAREPLEHVIKTYRRWSDDAQRVVLTSCDAGASVANTTQVPEFLADLAP